MTVRTDARSHMARPAGMTDGTQTPVTGPDAPSCIPARRHSVITRICHWINLACFLLLLPSGLQIFNAYPRLHFGIYGGWQDPAAAEIMAVDGPDGPRGITRIGPISIPTTGVLGVSSAGEGRVAQQAFPRWATLPQVRNLAEGRRWHFFVAWVFAINGAVYLIAHLIGGHFRRDIVPAVSELRPSHLARDIGNHLRGRFHSASGMYNTLQKLAYLAVIFIMLPGMILTGLAMSPGMNAAFPFLLDLFGGRASARSFHFIFATSMVLFVVVHVAMVILAGPISQMRGMITGAAPRPPKDKT